MFSKFKRSIAVCILISSILIPAQIIFAVQGVPSTLSYTGKLTDSGGNPLGAGGTTYYFKFSIWDDATPGEGNKLWPISAPNSVDLSVKQGSFSVNIGDTDNGYPDTLDYDFNTNSHVYLQVEVSSDDSNFETLAPRSPLSSTAFSQVANSVNGTADSSFGTTTPFLNTLISALSTNVNKAVMTIKGLAGQVANLFNITDSNDNSLFTVTADGKVGVGTSTPGAKLDVWGNLNVSTSATPTLFADATNGTVGIGTSGISDYRLGILSSTNNIMRVNRPSSNAYYEMTLTGSGPQITLSNVGGGAGAMIRGFSSSGVQAYFNEGNVGIGTTTPVTKLDVVGDFKLINSVGALVITGDNIGNAKGVNALDIQSTHVSLTKVASGAGAVAVGRDNGATNSNSMSFGIGNTNSGQDATAIGRVNTVSNTNAVAIGYSNTVSGINSFALGISNTANNTNSFAIGGSAIAGSTNTFALGVGAQALAGSSLAIGNGVINNTATSLMIGPSDAAKLTILSSGNIGIGTATPSEKLDVNGNINLPTTSSTAGQIKFNGTRYFHTYGNSLFVGSNSGNFTTTGSGNTGIGANTLASMTSGNNNTAIGNSAMSATQGGFNNSAFGLSSLSAQTSGYHNTAFGAFSGDTLTTGNRNTFIGFDTDTTSNSVAYSTALGHGALVGASNTMALGGTGTNAVNIIAGGTTASAKLHLISTTEQLRSGYDASNYLSTTIGNTGLSTFNAVGTNPAFNFTGGNVGIGNTTPSSLLDVGTYNTGFYTFRTGSFVMQPYSLNNGFLGENSYFNSSGQWTRLSNGYASGFHFLNGQVMQYVANTGSGAFTNTYPFKSTYANSGSVALGGNISQGATTYTGATMVVLGTGNVGIGTTAPASKLDITSTTNLLNNSDGLRVYALNRSQHLGFDYGSIRATGGLNIYSSGGTGIFLGSDGTTLSNLGVAIGQLSGNTNARLTVIGQTANSTGAGTGTVSTTIGSNIVTGVGTNFTTKIGQGYTITIGSNTYPIKSADSATQLTLYTNAIVNASGSAWDFTTPTGIFQASGLTRFYAFDSLGNSIGKGTAPQVILDRTSVKAWSMSIDSTNNGRISFNNITNGTVPFYIDGSAGDSSLVIDSSGNVGIGTTTPAQKLSVVGNAQFTGVASGAYATDLNLTSDGTLTTSASDERLKENITQLDSKETLEKILQLKPSSFDWKSNSVHDIGLIAQEVELIFPELVFTNQTDGYKGINYSRLPALLISAVQEIAQILASFADEFRTNRLCVGDTCITEDELKSLLENQNVEADEPSVPTPTDTPQDDASEETDDSSGDVNGSGDTTPSSSEGEPAPEPPVDESPVVEEDPTQTETPPAPETDNSEPDSSESEPIQENEPEEDSSSESEPTPDPEPSPEPASEPQATE